MVVNFFPEDLSLGITQKVNSQIATLRSMGNEVFYTAYKNNGVSIFNNDDVEIMHRKFPINNSKIFGFCKSFFLDNTAKKYVSDKKFNLGYIRWRGLGSTTINLLKVLAENCKQVVMDTHGYFPGYSYSFKNLSKKYLEISVKKNQDKVGKYLDLILSETEEKTIFGVKSMKYDNGVNIKETKSHHYLGDPNELNLISVANESIYHGYNRIIRSIKACENSNIHITLHLVGTVMKSTVTLIKQLNLENYIILHGKQYGETLDKIFDLCNVGIGPVSQHLTGGKQGTGLKTKLYFAKGLPFIYSGHELLVPSNYPYIMKVSDDESIIDFEKVYDFYLSIKDRNIVDDMREFADKNFSWEKTYKIMFEILNNKNIL